MVARGLTLSVALLLAVGCSSLDRARARGIERQNCPKMSFDHAIPAAQAEQWADHACAAWRSLWLRELPAIYGVPAPEWAEEILVQAEPVAHIYDGHDKGSECYMGSRCMVHIEADWLWFVGEVHSLFRARAFGYDRIYDRTYPTPEQATAAADACLAWH